jgi:uncharacterized protein YndB with AHSA1/START domain
MPTTVSAVKYIKVAPAQVYSAFTRSLNLREWLCDFATVALHPGGRIYLWWHGDFYSSGEYISLEENKSVVFTWFSRSDPGPSQVKVTVEPLNDGTRVTLDHVIPDWKNWKGTPEGFRKEWADSLENLASVLETGVDKRTFDRPMLGINVGDFTPAIARRMGVPVSEGMRLDGVVETMGAYQAGLRKDDVLVSLGGKPLTADFSTLVTALQGRKGGEHVEVVFYRRKEKKTVQMELTKRPIPDFSWNPAELAKAVRKKYDESLAKLEECFTGVSEKEADYHPAPGEWNSKEILAHLIDNERNLVTTIDDYIGGYERVADDFGGNITVHMQAIVTSYGTARGLLDELKRMSDEVVALAGALPPEFAARKSTYFQAANLLMNGSQAHIQSHSSQIEAAIAAARKK